MAVPSSASRPSTTRHTLRRYNSHNGRKWLRIMKGIWLWFPVTTVFYVFYAIMISNHDNHNSYQQQQHPTMIHPQPLSTTNVPPYPFSTINLQILKQAPKVNITFVPHPNYEHVTDLTNPPMDETTRTSASSSSSNLRHHSQRLSILFENKTKLQELCSIRDETYQMLTERVIAISTTTAIHNDQDNEHQRGNKLLCIISTRNDQYSKIMTIRETWG